MTEVMRVLEVDPAVGENSLQALLDGLLCMETQNAVRDLWVPRELTQCYRVLGRLPGEDGREFARLKLRR